MLALEDVSRRFGSVAAISNVSFEVQRGGFVFDGRNVTALRGRELRLWRARATMIFQQFNLIGRLDVLTNVLTGRLAEVPSRRAITRSWDRVAFLILLILAAVAAVDWLSARLRHAIIGKSAGTGATSGRVAPSMTSAI